MPLDECFQGCDTLLGEPPAAALISVGGIGETVAQHHGAARQRRVDNLRQVLGAGGKHQQQFGVGVHRLVARGQQ
ncbi:hypothetical protein D9M71_754580 [compost metagenome]